MNKKQATILNAILSAVVIMWIGFPFPNYIAFMLWLAGIGLLSFIIKGDE